MRKYSKRAVYYCPSQTQATLLLQYNYFSWVSDYVAKRAASHHAIDERTVNRALKDLRENGYLLTRGLSQKTSKSVLTTKGQYVVSYVNKLIQHGYAKKGPGRAECLCMGETSLDIAYTLRKEYHTPASIHHALMPGCNIKQMYRYLEIMYDGGWLDKVTNPVSKRVNYTVSNMGEMCLAYIDTLCDIGYVKYERLKKATI